MCNCNSGMDIRGRCCPMRNLKEFKKCGARVETAYFHMMNDCETYREINSKKTNKQKEKVMISYLHNKLKIIPSVEKYKIIIHYWEQDEERKKEEEKEDEDNENNLMIELRALLDNRYVIKQERYNNWSNSITIYAEFNCAVYSKKPNDKFAGYWNCGKCHCHYPCGTSKAFDDLISKYGYRHDVIDCSCVSGLWKIKK
jgi:hypothetical protein